MHHRVVFNTRTGEVTVDYFDDDPIDFAALEQDFFSPTEVPINEDHVQEITDILTNWKDRQLNKKAFSAKVDFDKKNYPPSFNFPPKAQPR